MPTDRCPRCGSLTPGAWSEGGLKWALCDACLEAERGAPLDRVEGASGGIAALSDRRERELESEDRLAGRDYKP